MDRMNPADPGARAMNPEPSIDARELLETNRRFHDARLVEPERFNTWPLVRSFVAASPSRPARGRQQG